MKGNHDKSFHYFTRSLKLFEELDDKYWMGQVYNGMGTIYSNQVDFDKALNYYKHSHSIRESLGDTFGMGVPLLNIGSIYEDKGDFDTALIYYKRSLQISEEIGNIVSGIFTPFTTGAANTQALKSMRPNGFANWSQRTTNSKSYWLRSYLRTRR